MEYIENGWTTIAGSFVRFYRYISQHIEDLVHGKIEQVYPPVMPASPYKCPSDCYGCRDAERKRLEMWGRYY